MTKEIIVNAGELESRVAVLENGRLMELHVEREPKIVGNIYKARIAKVLKGMDAAFVDIGMERNAFLSVSDVVAPDEDEGRNGHGRPSRTNLPSITELLHSGQELLVQVVRAPMGTKGARVTTRLSLPGRYMVLMLNSGTYTGVSRKIEDPKERQRLRAIANEIRPENYSLIVRTEAEDKSEDELRQDLAFLLDLARRIESKAAHVSPPSLVHGDLTLIFRLIRDSFTRDVNRLVIDSSSAYENALEMVGMIAPRLKNRVFLYDEPTPIFHVYNIEPEVERMLRRKVWLPSGGYLIIDQAEALTAIDVNTGRFVGTVELAETVLTTNLQAAEEVARQLRLRDLGGIIVVDFIDMDNPRHRQQVTTAFEEALRRDRSKIKVHSISPLGLVEMTRKRTGESLAGLLTEPCPYCSGIGRIQNSLTMALRIERELAATAMANPEIEAIMVTAHPRVIASMLGFEGEAHRDLEDYLGVPVYLRIENSSHPNAYRIELLSLEQAMAAVHQVNAGDMVEAQVVNPDPEITPAPLLQAHGIFISAPDLEAPVGARVKVRITGAGTSFGVAEPLAEEQRTIRVEGRIFPTARPPLVPEALLPAYLREESSPIPPRGLQLLSPTADTLPVSTGEEEISATAALVESTRAGRKRRNRRRKHGTEIHQPIVEEQIGETPAAAEQTSEMALMPAEAPEMTEAEPVAENEVAAGKSRRRRRRRGGRGSRPVEEGAGTTLEAVPATELPEEVIVPPVSEHADVIPEPVEKTRRRRNRSRRWPKDIAGMEAPPPTEIIAVPEPIHQMMDPRAAEEAMLSIFQSITADTNETPVEPPVETTASAEVPAKARRRRHTGKRVKAEREQPESALPFPAAPPVEILEIPTPEVQPIVPAAPELPAPDETAAEAAPAPEKPVRRRRTTATRSAAPRRRRDAQSTTQEEQPPAETAE